VEPPPKTADRSPASAIPEVKITESDSVDKPSGAQAVARAKKAEEPIPEEPRRPIVTGNDVKYLTTLGLDPSILDGRTTEFAKWLDYFGWVPGEKMRAKTFDEMRADIDRELTKAQAGGWLARFQEEDERVEAIKKGIDLAINECEELDNLLTLYSVELSVSLGLLSNFLAVRSPDSRPCQMILHTSKPKARVCRFKRQIKSC
jgi:hypothetical protein